MALLWAVGNGYELPWYVELVGVHLLRILGETPAGVLLLVGVVTMWVGWLARKRKEPD